MKFLFYDVETAQTSNRGSICAVGWVLYENDHFVNKGYSLINPHCRFSEKNVSIHGITAADVADSPSFVEYWNTTLASFASSAVFVSHNASFDISATMKALADSGSECPGIYYLDSLEVIRYYVDSDSYKLTELAKEIGFEYNAHNALDDVMAMIRILDQIRSRLEFSDFAEMFLCSPARCSNTLNDSLIKSKSFTPSYSNNHCTEHVEAIDDQLAGLRFCITGNIAGHERPDVEKMLMSHGAKTTGSVSGKTDYLVVGTFEDFPSGFVSSKVVAAQEHISKGGKIRIITPEEMFSMIK